MSWRAMTCRSAAAKASTRSTLSNARQRLQQVRIALRGGEVVIENAFLQRRQRVDVLHIGGAARHCGDNALDLA